MTYEYYFDTKYLQSAIPYYFSNDGTGTGNPLNIMDACVIAQDGFANYRKVAPDGSILQNNRVNFTFDASTVNWYTVGEFTIGGKLPDGFYGRQLSVQPNTTTAIRQASFTMTTVRASSDNTGASMAKHYITVRQLGSDEWLMVLDMNQYKKNLHGIYLFASADNPLGTPTSNGFFQCRDYVNDISAEILLPHGGSLGNLKVNTLSGSASGMTLAAGATLYIRIFTNTPTAWADSILKSTLLLNSNQKFTIPA